MANPWFRMYAEFANDPKVQMMSEADQRRFIMLLCMRCSNDDVTLHDDEVAFQLRISNEQWLQTKAVFIAKSLINDDNSPVAWDRRQFTSDSSAARVSKHRASKKQAETKCNVTVTPPDTDTDTDTDTENPRSTSTVNKLTSVTPAGVVCGRLKSEARITDASPQHPKLIALLNAGLTDDEIVSAGHEACSKGKGFSYALAVAEGRRRDASNIKPLPAKSVGGLSRAGQSTADAAARWLESEGAQA